MRVYAAVSFLFLLMLLLSFFSAAPVEADLSWNIQTVDDQNVLVGGNCPIVVDSNGTAHIAYMAFSNQTYSLIYASSNNTGWVSQTVDTGNLSRVFNLILDANGNPYILYNADPVTDSGHSLKFASYDGESWRIQNTGVCSDEADFQFDHLGHLHIAFVLGGNPLCYVNWTETALNIEIPDNTTVDIFNGISLAFDSENSPFILYNASAAVFGSRRPRLAYILDSEWRYQALAISGFVDSNGNLAVDSKDYRHAVFAVDNIIIFASFYESYHDSVIVASVAYDAMGGLCFDSQDNPHFCYTTQNHEIVYMARSNGSWSNQIVDSGSAYGRSDLILDSNGYVHISYLTNSSTTNSTNLMYAKSITVVPENISLVTVTIVGVAFASAIAVNIVFRKRTHPRVHGSSRLLC
jgi:hypothetical protein